MPIAPLVVSLVLAAPEGVPAAGSPPATGAEVILMHLGVPGLVYLGQPLGEFLAKFPAAESTPVAGQPEIVKVQVGNEGISCLAMGKTPATMTLESIGFNFGPSYEGISTGRRRTREGIGSGSTVNELLGTYGRPDNTSAERPPGSPARRRPGPDDSRAPIRHHYRSAEGAVTTYFVVQGYDVVRMVTGRPAEIEKHLSNRPVIGDRSLLPEGTGANDPPPSATPRPEKPQDP